MPAELRLRLVIAVSSLCVGTAVAVAVVLARGCGLACLVLPSASFASVALTLAPAAAFGLGTALGIRALTLHALGGLLARQRAEALRFTTAIDHISQGLCFFDGSQRLIVCNRRYAELYRLTLEQVRPGVSLAEIVDLRFDAGTTPEMSSEEYLAWRSEIAIADAACDTIAVLQDGRTLAIHHEPMPDGGWVSTHEDITERRHAAAQIERMAHHDALTGLPNRLRFREHLDAKLACDRGGQAVAVLSIDLDRFKDVNDTLGHPVGDELLRLVALRLRECVRPTDLVARLGGDEFAIVQADAPQPGAAQSLAARLVQAMALPFEIGANRVRVGASVGVALSPEHGVATDDLLKKSDLALYQAKANGRGNCVLFSPERERQSQRHHALEVDLRGVAGHTDVDSHRWRVSR